MPPLHYPIAERMPTLQVKVPYSLRYQYQVVTLGWSYIFVPRVDHCILGNVIMDVVSFETTPVYYPTLYPIKIVYGWYI